MLYADQSYIPMVYERDLFIKTQSFGVVFQLLLALHHHHKDLVILLRVGFGEYIKTFLVLLQCFAILALVVFAVTSHDKSSSCLFRLIVLRFSLFGLRGSYNGS